jgi:hypothetical protein
MEDKILIDRWPGFWVPFNNERERARDDSAKVPRNKHEYKQ